MIDEGRCKQGIAALTKELGPVGMAYFIQQYDRVEGDYTAEREKLLSGYTMGDAERDLELMRAEKKNLNCPSPK